MASKLNPDAREFLPPSVQKGSTDGKNIHAKPFTPQWASRESSGPGSFAPPPGTTPVAPRGTAPPPMPFPMPMPFPPMMNVPFGMIPPGLLPFPMPAPPPASYSQATVSAVPTGATVKAVPIASGPEKLSFREVVARKPGSNVPPPPASLNAEPPRPLPPEPDFSLALTEPCAHPVVVQILGIRGSGKTEQSQRLAAKFRLLHVSSGDLMRKGKDPLLELYSLLVEHFADGTSSCYRGLVLDRFLGMSTADIIYLTSMLRSFKLAVNLVAVLEAGHSEAARRAADRDASVHEAANPYVPAGYEKKDRAADSKRVIESRLLIDACKEIYNWEKRVLLHVSEGKIDEVADGLFARTKMLFTTHPEKRSRLEIPQTSSFSLADGSPMILDYMLFRRVRDSLHAALGNPISKYTYFPGSLMTGILNEPTFDRFQRPFKEQYFVTLKADGLRVLVAKVDGRFYAFPSRFVEMYEIDKAKVPATFVQIQSSAALPAKADEAPPTDSPQCEVSFILDCELVMSKKMKKHCFFAFDYLYYEGKCATSVPFPERLAAVQELVGPSRGAWASFHAKEFVRIFDLEKILPNGLDDPQLPFPVDGIVFQHSREYRVPQDKSVLKWKPFNLCSVDFSLGHSTFDSISKTWTFELLVQGDKAFPGVVEIPDGTVKDGISTGTVVECAKEAENSTRWRLIRIRRDKLNPNSEDVAETISRMKHMSLEDVKRRCAALGK